MKSSRLFRAIKLTLVLGLLVLLPFSGLGLSPAPLTLDIHITNPSIEHLFVFVDGRIAGVVRPNNEQTVYFGYGMDYPTLRVAAIEVRNIKGDIIHKVDKQLNDLPGCSRSWTYDVTIPTSRLPHIFNYKKEDLTIFLNGIPVGAVKAGGNTGLLPLADTASSSESKYVFEAKNTEGIVLWSAELGWFQLRAPTIGIPSE